MKLYVASSFRNKDMARFVMDELKLHGHQITWDWTAESTAGLDPIERAYYLQEAADADMKGALGCDALVLIDHPQARGAYTELGIALGAKKPIYVLDLVADPNIFLYLPEIRHCKDVDELCERLGSYE